VAFNVNVVVFKTEWFYRFIIRHVLPSVLLLYIFIKSVKREKQKKLFHKCPQKYYLILISNALPYTGLNGSAMSSCGVAAYCLDDTKPGRENPAVMGFILARHARTLALATPQVR